MMQSLPASDRTSNGDETKVPSNGYCVVKNNELSTVKGIEVVAYRENDFATSNGIQSGRSLNYDGGNGDELHAGESQVYSWNNNGGFEGAPPEDTIAGSSWEIRGKRNENHGSTDLDPLTESVYTLQSAQEALEKEVQKFREVGTLDDAVEDLPSDFTSIDLKLQETSSSKQIQSGKNVQSSFHSSHSELKEAANKKFTETELEDLFKLKVESEVEYLATSRSLQKLRVAAVDQITLLEEKITLASEQAQMLNMLENTKNRASMLKKEAEKLVNSCEDIACTDEKLKLQLSIYKYTSYFLVQFVMIVVILGYFVFYISSNYAGVVPT